MSLYNMMHDLSNATFFLLPMLGKHPEEYPRFRDCFTQDKEYPEYDGHIHVYTRTGGGNREDYKAENEDMKCHPNFVADYDDSFDCTFASWIFTVPEKWKADFDKILKDGIKDISEEYKQELYRVFPKLKEQFDELFNVEATDENNTSD